MPNWGHSTTTDEVLQGVDLNGKLALVTGGASGIGAETSRALASKGAGVIIAARNLENAEKVCQEIKKSTGNSNVHTLKLHLDNMAKIRATVERFYAEHDSLNLLINNAGVMACPHGKTDDGFELQFGTNHIGHFLFTCLLIPALVRGSSADEPARVVSLSSLAHRYSRVVFDDPNFERRDYDKWLSYGQSKTANALFAIALQKRIGEKGVCAFSVHPGVIMTNLARHLTEDDIKNMQANMPNVQFKTVEAGAATSVYAATDRDLLQTPGVYLENCGIALPVESDNSRTGIYAYAKDHDAAEQLWQLSEELVGETFAFDSL